MTDELKSAGTNLLILGASTRAAAFSARRAGLVPVCGDLFADQDLVNFCTVTRLPSHEFPHGFERLARGAPPGPWLYVGGLENHANLVGQISSDRPLWGNGADVLRCVRDPFQVAECLARTGLPCPEVQSSADRLRADARWLIKPIAGAGGRGILEYAPRERPKALKYGHYFQQRLSGQSFAALFVGDGSAARLIGLTRQLVGEPEFGAKPFRYCGSIGPLPVEAALHTELEHLGRVLAARFRLMGLFGVDGIIHEGVFWPVEVNPRYTASAEVFELALGQSLISLHRDACVHRRLPDNLQAIRGASNSPLDRLVGKAILFAPRNLTVTNLLAGPRDLLSQRFRHGTMPRIADIPAEGEPIHAAHPICSVFATHISADGCLDGLRQAARGLYSQLYV